MKHEYNEKPEQLAQLVRSEIKEYRAYKVRKVKLDCREYNELNEIHKPQHHRLKNKLLIENLHLLDLPQIMLAKIINTEHHHFLHDY